MKRMTQFVMVGAALAAVPIAPIAQRGGGFGPPMQQDRKILAQFDTNGDKRLDSTERKAAREWLAAQPAMGFGRRGGPFGGGSAEPAVPGRKMTPADVRAFPDAP